MGVTVLGDPDAKSLQAWRFGDILAHDPNEDGTLGSIRLMFVFPDYWADTFDALDLTGDEHVISVRHARYWLRIKKAER